RHKSHLTGSTGKFDYTYWRSDMCEFVAWVYGCIILHNMLAKLGNQWIEFLDDIEALPKSNLSDTDTDSFSQEYDFTNPSLFQKQITQYCVCFN
ncbi:hypothetical protein VP01_1250g4, partial [Puccinia sorghi]